MNKIQVVLDGVETLVEAAPGQTVLEAAEEAGLSPPSSCRDGQCAACMCTLVRGTVQMKHNNVLSADDLAEGWILACQALPTSADVAVRWPD